MFESLDLPSAMHEHPGQDTIQAMIATYDAWDNPEKAAFLRSKPDRQE